MKIYEIELIIICVLILLNNIINKNNISNFFVINSFVNSTPYNDIIPLESEFINIKIFVINLPHRTDRKESTIRLLNKLNFINYEFVQPIDKLTASNILPNIPSSQASLSLTHYNILKKCNLDKFVIMEDDLNIYSNRNLNEILKLSKQYDYDLFHLEMCQVKCSKCKIDKNNIIKLSPTLCAGFIIYTNKYRNFFLNKYSMYDLEVVDLMIYKLIENNLIKSYGYPYFRQSLELNKTSDIEKSFKYYLKKLDPICSF